MSGVLEKDVVICWWAVWDSFQQESYSGVDHIKEAKPRKWQWEHRAAL